jgi:hypothetical protein
VCRFPAPSEAVLPHETSGASRIAAAVHPSRFH